jgi:hypothetical protein
VASFDEAIPPGRAGKITAAIHTANLRGEVAKTITVTTNDPSQPAVSLTLKATIVSSVVLLPGPRMSLYGGGMRGEPVARLLVRRDPSEKGTLEVSSVRVDASWLQATARKIDDPQTTIEGLPKPERGDFLVEVRPGAAAPAGNAAQLLHFRTGLAREPEVTVPISVIIPPFATVQPPTVILMRAGNERPAEGTVLVVLRQDIAPDSLKIETQPAAYRAEVAQAGPTPRHLRLTVSWAEDAAASPSPGTITLRSGNQEKKIPIRIAQAPPNASTPDGTAVGQKRP